MLSKGKLIIQAGPTNEKSQRKVDLSHALAFERDDAEDGDSARYISVSCGHHVTGSRLTLILFKDPHPSSLKVMLPRPPTFRHQRRENLKSQHSSHGVCPPLCRFSLVTKDKDLYFTARNAIECTSWIENLQKAKLARAGNFTAHTSDVSALMF